MDLNYTLPNAEELILSGIKKHTLRRDPKRRWRAGMVIQHVLFARTKKRRCFSAGVCNGVEEVAIKFNGDTVEAMVIEERLMDCETIEILVKNDGFSSLQDFVKWFSPAHDEDRVWRGRIIHYTSLRYGK